MIFRNRQGLAIDAEAAEALMKAEGLEVCTDILEFDRQRIMVRSKLQPVCRETSEPLFLTMVFGDEVLGMHELPTSSETECRALHRAIVDRYLLKEHARIEAGSGVLIDGVL